MRRGRIVPWVLQLLGVAIVAGLAARIGLGRIAAVLAAADPRLLGVALVLGLGAHAARLLKLKLLLRGDPAASYALEVFVASRTGKEISPLGYFSPLLATRLRTAAVLEVLLVDRYLETLATLVLALAATFAAPPFPWATPFRAALGLGVALLAGIAAVPIPLRAEPHSARERVRRRIRDLQEALRLSLGDIRGAVFLTLVATLADFLIVGAVFLSLHASPSLFYVPIVWAATALVGALSFMAMGPADGSAVALYQALAGVPVEASGAMLVVGRGVVGPITLGAYALAGLGRERWRALAPAMTER